MRDLTDRIAVVTGAASGIGLAIAVALVGEGARVVLADIDEARLAREVARLDEQGAPVIGVRTDVADPRSIEALAEQALGSFGAVHLLCNNAGVVTTGAAWEITLAEWQRVIDTNLMGVVHGIRTFVPLILATGEEGHVVNVGSMASVVPVPSIGPYNVAKHGVLALSETLRDDLRAIGAPIGVTIVMPGRVRTRLGARPEDPDSPLDSDPPPASSGVIAPEVVGTVVIDAVKADRMFVFTHPGRMAEVRARFDTIVHPAS